jgi:serine/threonine protein kinase
MIGQTISHYKIFEKLGEGGMGVVYKAQDTTLDRFVALKFLPQHLAASDQDKARFVQEAKAAAALNHPNICSVIAIEECDGQMFIVMEFVDGQTLREKLTANPPHLKSAIEIGIQIADGLAAAHEKGIVHRDIKPENIMVRKDGICQIMDFGLAKLRASGSKITRLTKEGSTLGTAGYMSPEQVQGQDTDHRSDIFSYGVLLHELLTGQLPFRGVHETALAYEIVNVDAPPMSSVKPEIDPNLDAIVLECLEKDPHERTQSIAQISVDLKRYRRESSRQRASRVTAARPAFSQATSRIEQFSSVQTMPTPKQFVPWSVALVSLVIAVVFGAMYLRSTSSDGTAIRATILPPEKEKFSFYGNASGPPVISPDGKRIVFAAKDSADKRMLYIRSLDESEAHPLAGTEGAVFPFWSPDNQFVGFTSQGKLKKIEASGGPPITICNSGDSRGGSWSKEGMIVFTPGANNAIFAVSALGGTPAQITTRDSVRKETTHRWPFFLPDGKHFLFFARTTTTGAQGEGDAIRVASIDGKTNNVVLNVSSNAVYTSGKLLYVRGNSLVAQKFNISSLGLEGEATVIAQGIAYDPSISRGLFSASEERMLIYQTGNVQVGSKLNLVDRSGRLLGVIGDIGEYLPFRISPDNKRIVVGVFDQKFRNNDIWIFEVSRGLKTRFTFDPAAENNPIWSPDGSRVVFLSNRNGKADLYIKSASGAANEELLYKSNEPKQPTDWSPDGKYIVYSVAGSDIWVLPLETNGRPSSKGPFPFLATEFQEGQAVFSPDGHWIAYMSNESGQAEVYLRPFPGPGGKFQVSIEGGRNPAWRRDGKEIYYISLNDSKMMSAGIIVKGASAEVSNVHPLFAMNGIDYDVMSDGKFILNEPVETQLTSPLMLVVNWDNELKKK